VQKINLMVAGRSKYDIVELGNALDLPDMEIQVRHMNNGISNPLHYAETWPDILVFQLSDLGAEELGGLMENAETTRPPTIVIGPAHDMNCMKLSMRAGVREYLDDPCNIDELKGSIVRIKSELDVIPAGGSQLTTHKANGTVTASPAVVENGLLVGTLTGRLHFFTRNGEPIWTVELDGSIEAPVFVHEGRIVVPLWTKGSGVLSSGALGKLVELR